MGDDSLFACCCYCYAYKFIHQPTFSKPNLVFAGLIFFTIGDLLSLISSNFTILMAGRLIQGIGTGIAIPLMFNLVLTKIPRERVGL